jgi:hypothetical protein
MKRVRLGGEDAAWLHMDDATNPMVVDGLLELAERMPIDRVRSLVARVALEPRFRSRIIDQRIGRPTLEPCASFDPSDHLEHVVLPSGDDATLLAFVGQTVSHGLDPSRPMWRIHLVDRPGAGSVLLCRVHHALADGFALLGMLGRISDEPPSAGPWAKRDASSIGAGAALESFARLVTLPPDPPTRLRAELGGQKRVAWTKPVALDRVKEIAHATSSTVNDVLVAIVAGALGRDLARRDEHEDDRELRAMVPVNLRQGDAELGNDFGIVVLALPTGIVDPLARLTAVKRRMRALKDTPEAVVAHTLLDLVGRVPRPVEDVLVSFFGKKASLVLTNVPGPREPLTIDGVRIERMMFWVPQAARLGLGISILSYAGTVTMGVLADAACVPDPGALAVDLEGALDALAEESRTEVEHESRRAGHP